MRDDPNNEQLSAQELLEETFREGFGGKLPKEFNEPLKAYFEWQVSARTESDRGFVIISAVFVEALITESINTKYPKIKTAKLYQTGKAIDSFSKKIDIAWSLDVIDDDVYHDAHLIRRIRNVFAHDDITRTSLSGADIKDRLGSSKLLAKSAYVDQLFDMLGIDTTEEYRRFRGLVSLIASNLSIKATPDHTIDKDQMAKAMVKALESSLKQLLILKAKNSAEDK